MEAVATQEFTQDELYKLTVRRIGGDAALASGIPWIPCKFNGLVFENAGPMNDYEWAGASWSTRGGKDEIVEGDGVVSVNSNGECLIYRCEKNLAKLAKMKKGKNPLYSEIELGGSVNLQGVLARMESQDKELAAMRQTILEMEQKAPRPRS